MQNSYKVIKTKFTGNSPIKFEIIGSEFSEEKAIETLENTFEKDLKNILSDTGKDEYLVETLYNQIKDIYTRVKGDICIYSNDNTEVNKIKNGYYIYKNKDGITSNITVKMEEIYNIVGKTKEEAARSWVNEFDSIDYDTLLELMTNNIDDFMEVTAITEGDRVWVNSLQDYYTVKEIYEDDTCKLEDEEELVDLDECSIEYDDLIPSWGTLWSFSSGLDESWLEDNLREVSECGFRVIKDLKRDTYYLGIDGGGYDFYSHHWIPLYEARGLQWHI